MDTTPRDTIGSAPISSTISAPESTPKMTQDDLGDRLPFEEFQMDIKDRAIQLTHTAAEIGGKIIGAATDKLHRNPDGYENDMSSKARILALGTMTVAGAVALKRRHQAKSSPSSRIEKVKASLSHSN